MSRSMTLCVGLLALTPLASPWLRSDQRVSPRKHRDGQRRGLDRRPTNVFGLPVVDENGARVNYSPEELEGLGPIAQPTPARAILAPGYADSWAYAAFGTAVGSSNIVVAANGVGREILLGGSTFMYGPDTYCYSLRFRAGVYDQAYVSPYLSEGIARIEVGDVAANPGNEVVLALQEGRHQVHALSNKVLP